jgi:hypothetical protein
MAIRQATAALVPRPVWPSSTRVISGPVPAVEPRYAPSRVPWVAPLPSAAPLPWPAWVAPLPLIEHVWRPGLRNSVSKVGSTVQNEGITTGAAITTSFTVASGSNTVLLVRIVLTGQAISECTGVTYHGVAMTLIGRTNFAADRADTNEMWYLKAPDVGTFNVVCTFNTTDTGCTLGIDQWDGVDQTTSIGTYVHADAASSTPSLAVSGATGDMIVDVLGQYNQGTNTSTQTLDWSDNNATTNDSGAGSHAAGAASVTMGYTGTYANWWMGGVALKAAGGGGGPVLNDANYAATYRGMGVGMNRGMR